jgi:hypothetical protein
MNFSKMLSLALGVACAGGLACGPQSAWASGDGVGILQGNQPGSFLVFPKFDIRGDTTTQIRIVNNGWDDVNVKLNYVCPGIKNVNQFCAALDRMVSLTPHQTRVIDVVDQNPPCNQGFVVAYALKEDSSNTAASFNHLTGSYAINSGRRVESDNAIGIQSPKPHGEALGSNGMLRFGGSATNGATDGNGADYVSLPSKLYTDFRAITPGEEGVTADQGSVLTLLTLDTLAGQQNPAALAFVDFWNAAEEPFSSSVEFICWTEKQLDAIDANFLEENLGTTYGSMKITPAANCPIPGGCPPMIPFDATMLGAISEYGDGDTAGRTLLHNDCEKSTQYMPR